jgi:tetratricopeptide (TPR) repeat protein
MKQALLAGAIIAASLFSTSANAQMVVVHGRGPAQDCYVAAARGDSDRRSLALCDLALNHDFLTAQDRAATHVNRGVIYLRRGADLRALSDFNNSVAINPNVGEAHLMRGIALLQLGRLGEANESLTQAISLNLVRPERAYYYRGAAHEEAGNAQAAYADYRRAADIAPGWRSPQAELARFQVRRN